MLGNDPKPFKSKFFRANEHVKSRITASNLICSTLAYEDPLHIAINSYLPK